MPRSLTLHWNSGFDAKIILRDNPIADYLIHCVKHLQNIPLEFNNRDNPLQIAEIEQVMLRIADMAAGFGVDADVSRMQDQSYINHLHDRYVSGYRSQGDSAWLELHDLIHVLEDHVRQDRHSIYVDHKHRAGPLIKKFDRAWLDLCEEDCAVGDCYVSAHELGKTWWTYHRDGEPNDIDAICDLVRPWQWLKPVINIAFRCVRSRDLPHRTNPEYVQWRDTHLSHWCHHHGITDFRSGEEFAKIPVGRLQDSDRVLELFSRGECPDQLKL